MKKTKKFLSLTLCIVLVFSLFCGNTLVNALWDGKPSTGFASGNGSRTNPYKISTPAQLLFFANSANLGNSYSGKYIELTADISLNDTSNWESWNENNAPLNVWEPIRSFSGDFNGNGHFISGIYICSQARRCGFFSCLYNATITGLVIKDSYICAEESVGAIAGQSEYSIISDCKNYATVIGSNKTFCETGGIVGYCYSSGIYRSENFGKVKGSDEVGGIAGRALLYSIIDSCKNSGYIDVYGEYNGGIAGFLANAIVSNCYNDGEMSVHKISGGIAGWAFDAVLIHSCYNIATIHAKDYSINTHTGYLGSSIEIGAIIGVLNSGSNSISNCYYLKGCTLTSDGTPFSSLGFSNPSNAWGRGDKDRGDIVGETTPLSLTDLKNTSKFTGFDFKNIWTVESATGYEYPQLICLLDKKYAQTSSKDWNGTVASGFASGTGTASNPYIIKTAAQLAYLSLSVENGEDYSDKCFKLANDIVLNDTSKKYWQISPRKWTPIETFYGNFDGNGHKIIGLYGCSFYGGLFGSIRNSDYIKNINLSDALLYVHRYSGGIVGMCYDTKIIENCTFSGMFYSTYDYTGGIAGYNTGGLITNCTNYGTIICSSGETGGVIGRAQCKITNCRNEGNIFASSSGKGVGGVCGIINKECSNCSNAGNIKGAGYCIGSISGNISGGNMHDCCNTGVVSVNDTTGNFVGNLSQNGIISNCKNKNTSVTMPDWTYICKSNILTVNPAENITSLNSSSFFDDYKSTATALNIGKGFTEIANNSFADFTRLQSVDIPDSVNTIGSQAFKNCSSLNKVILPDNITSFAQNAFSNCKKAVLYCNLKSSTLQTLLKLKESTSLSFKISAIGDPDGNYKTDANDLQLVRSYLLGAVSSFDSITVDINSDGKFDLVDFICFKKALCK